MVCALTQYTVDAQIHAQSHAPTQATGTSVQFSTISGKGVTVSYPCVMLNTMVARHNTNDQYATLVDPAAKAYEVSSRMTIEFEVDGPYKVGRSPDPHRRPVQCRTMAWTLLFLLLRH